MPVQLKTVTEYHLCFSQNSTLITKSKLSFCDSVNFVPVVDLASNFHVTWAIWVCAAPKGMVYQPFWS